MWFLVFIALSIPPITTANSSDKIPCNHDVVCGKGECWEGVCEPSGYCAAYRTCV